MRAFDGTAAWFACRVHQPLHARVHQNTDAHGAGLQSDVKRGSGQSIVLQALCRCPQRDNLGMRAGIAGADRLVVTDGQQLPRSVDQHRTNRYFAFAGRNSRLCERFVHPVGIVYFHSIPDKLQKARNGPGIPIVIVDAMEKTIVKKGY